MASILKKKGDKKAPPPTVVVTKLTIEGGTEIVHTRTIGPADATGNRSIQSVTEAPGGKPNWFDAVAQLGSSPNGRRDMTADLVMGNNLYVLPIDPATGQPLVWPDGKDRQRWIRLGTIVSVTNS